MQWTPYEVKRLEYQLRVDAANRCPGTNLTDGDPQHVDAEPQELHVHLTLRRRVMAAMTTILRGRERAEAS